MSRRLLVLNVALAIVSVVLAVGVFRTLVAKRPLPPPPAPRANSAPAPASAPQSGDAGPGAYTVIAARNLFNPSRSETASAAAAAAPVAKPVLHGVVVDGAKSRAFLEDPAFKRVAGYSVGDSVGGGTIQKIADDRVIITRPEGPIEVLLQDPSKPRPAPTASAGPTPGGPPQGAPPHGGPPQAVPAVGVPIPGGPVQGGPPQAGPVQVGPAQAGQPPNVGPSGIPNFRQRFPLQRQPRND